MDAFVFVFKATLGYLVAGLAFVGFLLGIALIGYTAFLLIQKLVHKFKF